MSALPQGGLKLRAEDDEDLGVISACLQDALIPLSDMEFLAAERRFALVANRFRWENCDTTADMPAPAAPPIDVAFGPGCNAYERVHCAVTFIGVTSVRRRGFDQGQRGRILELLAIHPEPGAVVLEFAGDAAVRLEGERITCRLADLGEPWPTQWRPRHPAGDGA